MKTTSVIVLSTLFASPFVAAQTVVVTLPGTTVTLAGAKETKAANDLVSYLEGQTAGLISADAVLETALPTNVWELFQTNSAAYDSEFSTASWTTALPSQVVAYIGGVASTIENIVLADAKSGGDRSQSEVMRIGAAIAGGLAGLLML